MKLALFFTRGVSLKQWLTLGIFDREKIIYEEHLKQGNLDTVYWLTYGTSDIKIAKHLTALNQLDPRIKILQMPNLFAVGRLGAWLYSFFIICVHRRTLRCVDILKTNQMDGAWSACLAGILFSKPFILRTGYTKSFFVQKQSGTGLRYAFFKKMEQWLYGKCSVAEVTSLHDKKYVSDNYHIAENKVIVLSNFIDTNRFIPASKGTFENRLVFVGRLHKEKNLTNLIHALSGTDYILDIYGAGEEKENLQILSKKLNICVNFMGLVPNSELPVILNKYKFFILPSFYEGMPKALLEAMACGLVCIGTNVTGINEVIKDGITGILCNDISSAEIRRGIQRAFASDFNAISQAANLYVLQNYSLEKIVLEEKEILRHLVILE